MCRFCIARLSWPGRLLCGVLLMLALLSACSTGAAAPTPLAPLIPAAPRPTRAPASSPAPTIVASGAALPGRLLFVRDGDIWLWQGDQGGALIGSGSAFQPSWSPDGAKIAYVERVESASDILVAPAAGGDPLRLTNNVSGSVPHSAERIYESMWAFYPAWSPDGQELAFAGQGGPPFGSPAGEYRMSLFAIPAGGQGERQQLYAQESGHIGRLAYAPGGASIVFVYAPADQGGSQLYRFARDGGAAEPVPGVPEQSYDPVFSPDGRWLAFAAHVDGGTDIFAMPAAGGAPVRLTSLGAARAPVFSPDSASLGFLALMPGSNSFDLWVADLQVGATDSLLAGAPRQITHDMQIDADSGLSWTK